MSNAREFFTWHEGTAHLAKTMEQMTSSADKQFRADDLAKQLASLAGFLARDGYVQEHERIEFTVKLVRWVMAGANVSPEKLALYAMHQFNAEGVGDAH